ncbi:hypothetical protein OFC53_39325, partial [Escherichia coli]|nr:hypothetical protein [Escherichia coli]
VNQVFALPDSPFIYDSDIPFLPGRYSPNAEKRIWTMGGQKQPALTYCLQEADDKLLPKGEYLTRMSEATASLIQTILT